MDRGSQHCTEGSNQNHAQEEEMQKGKMVVRKEEKQKAKEKRKNIPI